MSDPVSSPTAIDCLDDAPPSPAQRAPRVRTLIHAVLAREGEPGSDGVVRNVSPGGLCIASRSMTPAEGDLITVTLAGLSSLEAQVRWAGDGEFGVKLTSGLNPLLLRPAAAEPAPACNTALRRWLSGWRDGFGKRASFEPEE